MSITTKKHITSFAKLQSRLLLYALSALIAVFILASSFETAFGQDLPYVNAVKPVSLNFLTPKPGKLIVSIMSNPAREGSYGSPAILKISSSSLPITVSKPVLKNNSWLAKTSTAHYITYTDSRMGNIGDTILYMTENKTTINHDTTVKKGESMYIETNRGWRYYYKIEQVLSVSSLNNEKFFLPFSEKTNRVFIVTQKDDGSYIVISATLTSLNDEHK